MTYLAGFAPWIAFWVLAARNGDERRTLLVACAVALAVSLVSLLLQRRTVGVSSLDIGSIAFFAGFAVATQFADDTWLATYNQFVSNTALFLIVGVGLLLGHPFTQTYARAAVPETMWREPHFVHSNQVIARVWVAVFAVMALSSGLLLLVPVTTTSELVLNWVVPFGAFGSAIAWQTHYVAAGIERGRAAAAARMATPIEPGTAVVSGVDHVTTTLPLEEARRLAGVLTDRLHLVRAWNWADFGDFASGGWRIGNVNLEVIGLAPTSAAAPYLPDRFVTLAPVSTEGLAEELARRGLTCSDPYPQSDDHGRLLYTRYELPDLSDRFVAQLCAYAMGSGGVDAESRPNPAGFRHVTDVRIGSRDPDRALARWGSLLAPVTAEDGRFTPVTGPAVSVERAGDDDVVGLSVEVDDVDAALGVLRDAGLDVRDGVVALGTLPVRLVAVGARAGAPAPATAPGAAASAG